MYCPKCAILLPYDKLPEITECTVCGRPFLLTALDIFKHKALGIAREIRPSQLELAEDIEQFLESPEDDQTLLAEGGTGIGKSFAYLVPAIMASQRTIISTATKGLQAQLYRKDLKFLLNKLDLPQESSLLYKGTDNYACWVAKPKKATKEERERFGAFINDARQATKPADRDNWKGPIPSWWPSVSAKNCMGLKCKYYSEGCRAQPSKYKIVVVNHHILAIDLMLGGGKLLGEYDTLIVDEAHRAPNAFRSAYTYQLSAQNIYAAIYGLEKNSELSNVLYHDLSYQISTGISLARSLANKIDTFYTLVHATREKQTNTAHDTSDLHKHLLPIQKTAKDITLIFHKWAAQLHQKYIVKQFNYLESLDDIFKHMGTLHRMANTCNAINAFSARFIPDLHPNYILVAADGTLTLLPLEIGPLVSPPLRGIKNKIFTSATLQIAENFTHIKKELGVDLSPRPANITTKVYESPFNLHEQALLYIPRHLPKPANTTAPPEKRKTWIATLTQEIVRLTNLTKGNAFVLFSAETDMNEVLAYRAAHFPQPELHILKHQGEAASTLETFQDTNNCVLYGLRTFWEGIDVSGKKLQLVIIPKLPFPHVNDPVIAELANRAGRANKFDQVFLPRMLFDLKQGAGRLIRTQTDYGVIAVLDPRIWTGGDEEGYSHESKMRYLERLPHKKRKPMGYGKKIVATLGYTRYQDDFTQVQMFVKRCLRP